MGVKTVSTIALVAVALAMPAVEAIAKSGSRGGAKGGSPGGSHTVRSYNKKDGTRVAAHKKTNPDQTKRNNYSSKGNTNPNTGKEGTKDPNKP